MSERESGIVKWLNKENGYGFIQRENGKYVFVNFADINENDKYAIAEGLRVEFAMMAGRRGLRAEAVSVLPTVS